MQGELNSVFNSRTAIMAKMPFIEEVKFISALYNIK